MEYFDSVVDNIHTFDILYTCTCSDLYTLVRIEDIYHRSLINDVSTCVNKEHC